MKRSRIAVIGAGSWGTCLARLLAERDHAVSLWCFEPELVEEMARAGENRLYLPGIPLPRALKITSSLQEACVEADLLLLAVPTQFMRGVLGRMRSCIERPVPIVSACKGIEQRTLTLPSQIILEAFPDLKRTRVAVLSGPSFAKEVALSHPTAVSLACEDYRLAVKIQRLFTASFFRLFLTTDLVGVQIGGALKNVIALAAGGSDGLGFGFNAKAALITRGLTEIMRLGLAMGAEPETFFGLSGVGDLVLTCTGQLSRNWQVGYQIGLGRTLPEVLKGMKMVAEGVETARSARALSQKHGVEMPIVRQVYSVLFEEMPAREAVLRLLEDARGDEVPEEIHRYFGGAKRH